MLNAPADFIFVRMDHFIKSTTVDQMTMKFNLVLRGLGCLDLLQKISFLMLLLLTIVMSFQPTLLLQIRCLFLWTLRLDFLTLFFMPFYLCFVLVSCKSYLELILIILLLRVDLQPVSFIILLFLNLRGLECFINDNFSLVGELKFKIYE